MNYAWSGGDDVEGGYRRVLCVCSAGLLRSATMAWVFAQEPYGFNCRCAGTEDYALIPVTAGLVNWCDEIICAKEHHRAKIADQFIVSRRKVHVLDIEDSYSYRDRDLVKLIKKRYGELTK